MSTHETESDGPSAFSNENLNVSVTKKPHCQIKFDIRVNPEPTEAAYQKAIKVINKEVSIPGFRKGKAPVHIVVEKYDSAIQKEFVDVVLQTAFNEALSLSQLHPLKDGRFKRPVVHECSREKGAHFTIEFEERPHFPTIELEEIQIKKVHPRLVTDQDRQNAINNLLLQFTTYDPIEDRPAKENDFVDISVTLLEEPPREVVRKQRTQLNATGLPSWMRKEVIDLKPGESKEGMTQQDPTLSDPDPNFQSVPFRVDLHSIWHGNLPAIDEELVKKVGLKSEEELHQKINERLEREASDEAFQATSQAIENRLIEKFPIDLPQSYIDANKEDRLTDYLVSLNKKKKELSAKDYKQIEKMIEESTVYNLQLYFLLRKIASDFKISITQEDVNQELSHQVALMSSGRNAINFSGDKEKIQEQLHNLALDRKIRQFLVDNASK